MYMKSKYPIKMKQNGNQVMVARQIYLEPELWDLMNRLAGAIPESRSTYIRKCLKSLHMERSGIEGINWDE